MRRKPTENKNADIETPEFQMRMNFARKRKCAPANISNLILFRIEEKQIYITEYIIDYKIEKLFRQIISGLIQRHNLIH